MIVALYRRWVDVIVRNPARAVVLLLLAMIPTGYFTALYFMNVRAGLQDLLPRGAESVRALEELHARIGGVSSLIVIVHSPDAVANRKFMSELGPRLVAKKIPEAKSIRYDVVSERKWLERRGALLLEDAAFDRVLESVEDAIASASPLRLDLDEAGDGFADLKKQLEAETQKVERFPNGYMETPDGTMVVMLIGLNGSEVDIGPALGLARAVHAEVDTLKAQYPNVQVALSGEVENLIEEHDAIQDDIVTSVIMVLVLNGILIALYFRSARAIIAVVGSLAPGILWTFAVGRLSGSELNSNSAFLGSIIAGNGINYPLILLAFYRNRDPSEPMAEAIVGAARQSFAGTLGAAATASAAYLGLASASFRGFSDFGFLGGVGMISTWAVAFMTMPILIAIARPPRHGTAITEAQGRVNAYFSTPGLARGVAAALVLTTLVVATIGVRAVLREGYYDMNLLNLRNSVSLREGGASWDKRVSELFGVWLNPIVGMVDEPSDRHATAAALRAALLTGEEPVAERIETIDRLVPPVEAQQARIGRLSAVKRSLAKVPREKIPAEARVHVDTWLSDENLQPITAEEVPTILTMGFRETSGRTDRTVLAYPSLKIDYNDGRNIVAFLDELAKAELPKGAVLAGGFLFMGEIISLVRSEVPRVIGVVCLLVALTLVPLFWRKPGQIVLVLVTVIVVAALGQAVMYAAGVRLNMLNFAAIPITIGVGADYVVNLIGAMDSMKLNARQAVAKMGGAVLLCSLTTVVGYLSLLLAHSGALRSFGWAAVLGELMAVTVVLVILPVLMRERVA